MVKLEFKEFDVVVNIIAIAEDGVIEDLDDIKKDLEDKISHAAGEVVVNYFSLYDLDVSVNTENIHPYNE